MGARCSTPEKYCAPRGVGTTSSAITRFGPAPVLQRDRRVVDLHAEVAEEFKLQDGDEGLLHKGRLGVIRKARHRRTNQCRAVRQVPRDKVSVSGWRDEVMLLKKFDHPHICRLYETFEGDQHLSQVMELCLGQNLMVVCQTNRAMMTDVVASVLTWQMLSAVGYIHGQGVCHAELAPECFVFSRMVVFRAPPLSDLCLKLIDFGLLARQGVPHRAATDSRTQSRQTQLQCQAPEQRASGELCDEPCDVWAVGAISSFILSGAWPTPSSGEKNLFAGGRGGGASSRAGQAFLAKCLAAEPPRRPTAKQLLSSDAWMVAAQGSLRSALPRQRGSSPPPPGPSAPRGRGDERRSILDAPQFGVDALLEKLDGVAGMGDAERAAMTAVAHRLPEEKTGHLRQIFQTFDTDCDGSLTIDELRKGLKGAHTSRDHVARLIKKVDTDGNGSIECTEFIASTYAFKRNVRDSVAESALRIFDQDGDGDVSLCDFRKTIGRENEDQNDMTFSKDVLSWDQDGERTRSIDILEFMCLLPGSDAAADGTRVDNTRSIGISCSPRSPRAAGRLRNRRRLEGRGLRHPSSAGA